MIVPAPSRVGEDEPPPSWDPVPSPWDPVPSPRAMVGRDSPKFAIVGRGSPRHMQLLATAAAAAKRRKNGCSPKGDNGWSSEAWNKIVKEFHERNKYVSFTKSQIQEKEKELKRDYKMLKEARKQSGCQWNEDRCMIEDDIALFVQSFPKAKKFRNNKASFPLYDTLGELYDGHLAEGTYNITSSMAAHDTLGRGDNAARLNSNLDAIYDLEAGVEVQGNEDEDTNYETRADGPTREDNDEAEHTRNIEETMEASATSNAQRSQRRPAPTSRNRGEKEQKRPRSSTANIEGMMEKYLDMRKKQFEDDAALLQNKQRAAEGSDFSIKKCISVLSTMGVTREEKTKAFGVFKDPDNREIFLSAFEDDPQCALAWLRFQMDQADTLATNVCHSSRH
ncbi:hypothetical protein EJB05_09792, partial [Eragrostis curvula]